MGYPADKETWDRVDTNDIITKESTNNWEIFLEALQETLGYGANTPFPLLKSVVSVHSYLQTSADRFSWVGVIGISEVQAAVPIPVNTLIKSFYCKCATPMQVGSIVTVTLMHNGNPTAITLTFTSADGTTIKTDLVNEVVVSAGDTLSMRWSETGGTFPATNLECSMLMV